MITLGSRMGLRSLQTIRMSLTSKSEEPVVHMALVLLLMR
jgi:hypothetical protein